MTLYISIGVFLILGLVLLFKGLHRLWTRRLLRGSLQSLSGLLFVSLAFLAGAIAMNLYTYQVFNQEQALAEVRFEALGPQYFRIYFSRSGEPAQLYELHGDEWQVDARILKWHGLANLLGMKTVCRLDRLSGRYRNINQERYEPRSVHSLAYQQGLDLWQWSREYQKRIPWVDAVYGSAAYVPMANRAQFSINLTTSGLLIRPLNLEARNVIEQWK